MADQVASKLMIADLVHLQAKIESQKKKIADLQARIAYHAKLQERIDNSVFVN